MTKPTLCVDFDGVIHSYTSSWLGPEIISDPPVPGALDWLKRAIEHFDVVIYSSRSKAPTGIRAMKVWIEKYSDEVLVNALKFAHEKPAAFLTIDDRAICFEGDWSKLGPQELLGFKPWNKRG